MAALVLYSGTGWTVVIEDLADAVAEKRGGQLGVAPGRLLPKGYSRESFADKKANTLDQARIAELGRFIEQGQKETGVPGVALGLVQDGKVIFADGFGVKELGGTAKPDGETLFMIASNTKALTTLMLAKLVEEHKMNWDTQVTTLYPDFKLGDAATTQERARQASDLRVYRNASARPGVALRVREDDSAEFYDAAGDDAAYIEIRRAIPVFKPDGRGRRLHGWAHTVSEHGCRQSL